MGTITMISSGHDGVGKSTTTVFLADALSADGEKVLILELDSGSRSQDILCGIGDLPYDLLDLLQGTCAINQSFAPSANRQDVYVMPGSNRQGMLPARSFARVCREFCKQFDHILIDTACATGITGAACSVSQNAVVVCTADPFSIRDSYNEVEQLRSLGMTDIRLVINRLVPARIEAGVIETLDDVIDGVGARLIGIIPESSEIAISAAHGIPLVANTSEYEIFRRIERRMHGEDVPLLIH